MDRLLKHLNKHYTMVKDEELFKLFFRFNVEQLEGIRFIKSKGWKEEKLKGGQSRYWNPAVKDKNSLTGVKDIKKLNNVEDVIDIEREKTKHKFLRDKEN